MVVSSVSLMPLGLELWGEQAAVSCCTCQNNHTNHNRLTIGCTYPFGLSSCKGNWDGRQAVPVMPSMKQHELTINARLGRPEGARGLMYL